MDKLISLQQAIDALCKSECGCGNAECRHKDDMDFCVTCDNVKIINSLPSAQPDLDEWCTDCKEYDSDKHCCPRFSRVIREALKEAQPERKTGRWIPITERLPEEYGEFLVTYKSDGEQIFMDIIEYEASFEYDHEKNRFKGNWLFADDWQAVNSEVIAWMPLPEPYQERGEQE